MTGQAPFVVAHRAGNDARRHRRAQDLALPLIEADVHLFHGRLEVRHRKTLGPVPLYWDTWEVAPPWAPRRLLAELLAESDGRAGLMLDLKGRDPRMPRHVAAAITASAADPAQITVCSRTWWQLERLRAFVPAVRVVHSVGSRRQLRALQARFAGTRLEGVSIHQQLLDPATVAGLRRRAGVVMSWPVETPQDALRLADWGVHGLISRDFETVGAALA